MLINSFFVSKSKHMKNKIRHRFRTRTWEDGFTGTLKVRNKGDIIDSWQAVFESEFAVNKQDDAYEIIGAEVISEEELNDGKYRYVIEPLDYNRVLDTKESIFVTFNSIWEQEEIPEFNNIIFNTLEVESENNLNLYTDLDFTLVNDWGTGFEGRISITNNSDSNIDTWSLQFDFPNQINNIWDAEIEVQEDGSYVIGNARRNREIPAG